MLPDRHSHILLHGLDAMISGAKEKGLKDIAITEHISQFSELRDTVKFISLHKDGKVFRRI